MIINARGNILQTILNVSNWSNHTTNESIPTGHKSHNSFVFAALGSKARGLNN